MCLLSNLSTASDLFLHSRFAQLLIKICTLVLKHNSNNNSDNQLFNHCNFWVFWVLDKQSEDITLGSGYWCSTNLFIVWFHGVVYDSGESLLIFELNSQTNTPLPSVLLQTCVSNAQQTLKCLVETWLKRLYLTSWVGGSTRVVLFVSCLQSQGCV